MTKHLERTILMKVADINTNSPSSLCRFAWLGVQVLTIYLRYISSSFFSFWNIGFSWLHSMWCSGISIIRIRWKQTSPQNDVKILIFPIPISQGRSVTILAYTHTGPYGLKNFVQNKVFAPAPLPPPREAAFPLIHISAVYRVVYNITWHWKGF